MTDDEVMERNRTAIGCTMERFENGTDEYEDPNENRRSGSLQKMQELETEVDQIRYLNGLRKEISRVCHVPTLNPSAGRL